MVCYYKATQKEVGDITMAIEIPTNFESNEAKIDWIREQMIVLGQDAANPAIESERNRLVSAHNALLIEMGVDLNPEKVIPHIEEIPAPHTEP